MCYAVVGMRSGRVRQIRSLALAPALALPFIAALACGIDDRSVVVRTRSSSPERDASEAAADEADAESLPARDGGDDPKPPDPTAAGAGCRGCLIQGACVPEGSSQLGTCLICDPERSPNAYVPALPGARCGSAPSLCSGQDTCGEDGACLPNDFTEGTPCGPDSGECDPSDTCDGHGACMAVVSPDDTECDDGAFCTEQDRCIDGQCAGGRLRLCGSIQVCDELLDACVCDACVDAQGVCVPETVFFADGDGDGFGAPRTGELGCEAPPGRVANDRDCCDRDAETKPGQELFFSTPDACGEGSWDRNCDGEVQFALPDCTQRQDCDTPQCGCVSTSSCSVGDCGTAEAIFLSAPSGPYNECRQARAADQTLLCH